MSTLNICKCDHCGKRVDHRCATAGWLHVDGAVSRAVGVYAVGSWRTDYLRGPSDFCSLECLAAGFAAARDDDTKAALAAPGVPAR